MALLRRCLEGSPRALRNLTPGPSPGGRGGAKPYPESVIGCCVRPNTYHCAQIIAPFGNPARRRPPSPPGRGAGGEASKGTWRIQHGLLRHPLRISRKALSFVLYVCCLAVPGAARAEVAVSEYDVKAAFLFNFTKFVEWPPMAFTAEHSPLKICVLGENPFGKTLRLLTEEEATGRRLSLIHLDKLNNLEACHVLYISRSERDRLPQVLAALHSAPVLTVGDTPGFIDQGGMINFIREGSKVRFDVNQETAERAGLKISSRLLALAKHVKGSP
jgi:hypothetical protein